MVATLTLEDIKQVALPVLAQNCAESEKRRRGETDEVVKQIVDKDWSAEIVCLLNHGYRRFRFLIGIGELSKVLSIYTKPWDNKEKLIVAFVVRYW